MKSKGMTWKNVKDDKAREIKSYLLGNGGFEENITNEYEKWRIRFSDSTFICYKTGKIYSTPSNSNDPAVFTAWKYVESIIGSSYNFPTKDFLIGFDETGKGELIGHMILTCVIFPKELFRKMYLIVGPSDTKKQHNFEYWDKIFQELDSLRVEGFDFINEEIPPWEVDIYHLNKIMDITYQRLLNIFFRKVEINRCRIVLDDYNLGPTLKRFLNFLEKQGAEVIVTHNAEDSYLEVKVASLISKRFRTKKIKSINENPEFEINGLSIGSGNAADPRTIEWLKAWYASGKPWPWFIKKSFKTIREIEGRPTKVVKKIPPIREDILSKEFLEEFDKGRLSIQSLSLDCPICGNHLKSVTFAIFEKDGKKLSELKCPNCQKFIKDANFTLRYYCPFIVPDSSIIQRNLISNDLDASRFFEEFTIILTPEVRKECNGTSRGKKEFEKLQKYHTIGRIKLNSVGRVEEIPNGLSGTVRDERIIECCLKNSAILLTADKSMNAFASGKNVFTIFI